MSEGFSCGGTGHDGTGWSWAMGASPRAPRRVSVTRLCLGEKGEAVIVTGEGGAWDWEGGKLIGVWWALKFQIHFFCLFENEGLLFTRKH